MAPAEICEGQGGLKKVKLNHKSGASAEVYLWGATLTSYKSPNGKENIFVSPGAIWDGKKAIRGGVPIVFPQFGQPDKSMPQHGFVRTSEWACAALYESDDSVCATLTIRDSAESRAKWPFAFVLDYLIKLTADSLTMRLRIVNIDDKPFDFMALLHTYFCIGDIGDVKVSGLKGLDFVDKVAGGETKSDENEEVTFPSFTDRVYIGTAKGAKDVVIKDGGVEKYKVSNIATFCSTSSLHMEKSKPCDVVCWNPYEEASPGDLPPPAFKGFVCVEPGLVNTMHTLPSLQSAEVSQVIHPC